MKDGVVGFPRTVFRLLEAGEFRLVVEYQAASPSNFILEGTDLYGEAAESIIKNRLDEGVVFPLATHRVEIHRVRVLRVQDDEGAVFVSAQNNSTINLKLINLRSYMQKNDGKVRTHVMEG